MEFKSFYKKVDGNEGGKCHYPTRLDTYGCGCSHDCSYCYAKSLLNFRGLWHPEEPRVADKGKVLRTIQKMPRMGAVRIGGMTDCFQPIERTKQVTMAAIKALNEKRQPYLIVTKSPLVAHPAYMEAMDKDLAHIQITITCFDDAKYYDLAFEKAEPPTSRILAVEELQRQGFDVQVRLSPFIPEIVDFDKLNRIRCDKILVEFLRVNSWIQKWFDINYSEYTVKQSGYRHLPLEKKLEYIRLIDGFREVTVCEDETTAYEYWKEHFNPNPNDCCNLRSGTTALF